MRLKRNKMMEPDKLKQDALGELAFYKENFVESRYEWLIGIIRNPSTRGILKAQGYIEGLRDCGRDVGNIVYYLEALKEA